MNNPTAPSGTARGRATPAPEAGSVAPAAARPGLAVPAPRMFLGGYLGSCAAQVATYAACTACQCAGREVLRHSARLAWSVLFFLAMVLAWVLRDFATPLLEKIPCERRG